jgi:hypothetical protein
LAVAISRHKRAFFADVPSEVRPVALHALLMIVSGQRGAKFDDLSRRTPLKLLPLDALNMGLYAAAICKDRDQLWSAEVAAKLAVSFSAAELAHLAKSQDFDANMISASQGEGIDRLRILVRSAKSKGRGQRFR